LAEAKMMHSNGRGMGKIGEVLDARASTVSQALAKLDETEDA
jgi:hypothetical protein